MTSTPNEIRQGEWTDAAVKEFWDYWSHRQDRDWYFSRHFATALVRLADWSGALRGRVLDYGCAMGDLSSELVQHNVDVEAVEFSQDSLDAVHQKLKHSPHWQGGTLIQGVPTPLEPDRFDVIYCVEVVEHLRDDWLESTLSELYRLLKPGGVLVLTTPHVEDIQATSVYCPFCRTEYHPAQHVRSVSSTELRGWLDAAGFDVSFCQGIDLRRFQEHLGIPPWGDWSLNSLKRSLGFMVLKSLDRWFPRSGFNRQFRRAAYPPGPNLCVLAGKALP